METNKSKYDTRFYRDNRADKKLRSVEIVLEKAMTFLPEIRSAVDFGCGVGTWLAGLQRRGVTEVKGLDGAWVDKELLVIPRECFVETDFDKEIKVDGKYDLAVSIEVAEHLPEKSAEGFIKALTDASDIILFSAAIPFQAGEGLNHVNEQWPAYWNRLFNNKGFIAVDCLRKRLWDNRDVLSFHRQNIMLFVKENRLKDIQAPEGDFCIDYAPMAIVDHKQYLRMVKEDLSRMSLLKIVVNSNKWFLINLLGKKFCRKMYHRYIKRDE
ncbi:MAG: class I SAM-dependent methyltransferase [Tannerella sp.]|jgi:SAM-dependent methyltransferase|nr:class I SAM-dependent methyltransferase [Tannerella sp.]